MPEITDLAVRKRAFQLADRDGYVWLAAQSCEPVQHQPVVDDAQRRQYLERARVELAGQA